MILNRLLYLLTALLFLGACYVCAQDLVIKKKKNPSKSSIQQQCCECCVDLVQEIPAVIELLAQAQQEDMKHVYAYFEGDAQAVFSKAQKERLAQAADKMNELNKTLQNLKKELEQHIAFMRSLHT